MGKAKKKPKNRKKSIEGDEGYSSASARERRRRNRFATLARGDSWKMLVIGTHRLDDSDVRMIEDTGYPDAGIYPVEYGWVCMWVPAYDDIEDHCKKLEQQGFSEAMCDILRYASCEEYHAIYFDRDGC